MNEHEGRKQNKMEQGILNTIEQGDCKAILPNLPKAKMIFADPPDNLGLHYSGFNDRRAVLDCIELACEQAAIVWVSHYYKYLPEVLFHAKGCGDVRLFLWRFTFGQHRSSDCGNGYRPLIRIMQPGAALYPNAIREPSARQTKYNDKRANPAGRVPDDVWEFPRVCGTFSERRKWHPNQHPEALIERIVKFSTRPGDLVIDMFAGTDTVNRVCKKLKRQCISIEISPDYCKRIQAELGNRK